MSRGYGGDALLHVFVLVDSLVTVLAWGTWIGLAEATARIDEALGAGGELAAMVSAGDCAAVQGDGQLDAMELARRAEASDVSDATLTRIELAFDDLATAYSTTSPSEL